MPNPSGPSSFVARRCWLPGVEAVEAWSHRSFARHTHEAFGFGRLASGAQRSWSGRGHVEAGPGDVITVNPGEVHDGAPVGEARAWRMLYLAPEVVGGVVTDIREGAAAEFEFSEPVVQDAGLGWAFDRAYDALAGAHAGPEHGEERLILVLAGLVRNRVSSRAPDVPGLARARSRIDDDPAGRHALADLAEVAGVSRFQVLRGFAKLTGMTPHAYVLQRRLDAARSMIRGGADLAAVAAACGFADQSHLNRLFKGRYGLTPGGFAAAIR